MNAPHADHCTFCGVAVDLPESAGNALTGAYPSMTHPQPRRICVRVGT